MPFKKFVTIAASFLIILSFILFPSLFRSYTEEILNTYVATVVPSVFPFIICVNLLLTLPASHSGKNGFLRSIFNLPESCLLPIFASTLSGFPMGGRITSVLFKKGEITSDEAQRLLSFVSNPSPVFVICVLGSSFLGSPLYGRLIYISCILGAFLTAIIFRFYYTEKPVKALKADFNPTKTDFCAESVKAMLKIGAFMVFFGILGKIFSFIPVIGNTLYCLCEMTSGTKFISLQAIDLRLKLSLMTFLASFGGICIFFQSASFFEDIPVKAHIVFISTLIKACFCAIFCYALFPLFSFASQTYSQSVKANPYLFLSGIDILKITVPLSVLFLMLLGYKKRQT